MKRLIQKGSKIVPSEFDSVTEVLPVGHYEIVHNTQMDRLELSIMSAPQLPKNEFVDTSIVQHWLKAYNAQNGNMGVLMSGIKGTGKTVLAKKVCMESNLPVIHLNKSFDFNEVASLLSHPGLRRCILFIDEFDKVVNHHNIEEVAPLLKLLDGGYNTNILFLFTTNSMNLNEYLNNRLSRIKYLKMFNTLEPYTIDKIIDVVLKDKSFEKDLRETLTFVPELSIDILMNIIEEINLFKQPASILVKNFNIVNSVIYYNIEEFVNGKWKHCDNLKFNSSEEDEIYFDRSWVRIARSEIKNEFEGISTNKMLEILNKTDRKNDALLFSKDTTYSIGTRQLKKENGVFVYEKGNHKFRLIPSKWSASVF